MLIMEENMATQEQIIAEGAQTAVEQIEHMQQKGRTPSALSYGNVHNPHKGQGHDTYQEQ